MDMLFLLVIFLFIMGMITSSYPAPNISSLDVSTHSSPNSLDDSYHREDNLEVSEDKVGVLLDKITR